MSSTGTILTDPEPINYRFREYYRELHRSKTDGEINVWWKYLNIPKLDRATCEALNSELSSAEIMDSIKSLPNGKSPGQDGFGVEVYKKFAGKIIPAFHRILSHSTKVCGQSTNLGKLGHNARKI